MKTLFTIIIAALAINASALVVQIPYTFAFTVLEQGATNGTTTAKPTSYKITNKELLSMIAQGEYFNGYYPSASFPTGSKIVWQYDFGASTGYFIVVDSAGGFLCDVSDIIDLSADTNPSINSGTNLKSVYYYANSLTFDNTAAGGSVSFYAGGVVTETVTDAPAKTGGTTETRAIKYSPTSGSGSDDMGGLVITGTISASGKYSL